jgi:hypothetical protein
MYELANRGDNINIMKNQINNIAIISIVASMFVIASCSSGSNSSSQSNNPVFASINVPATTYADAASSKFAVYTSAGNGKNTLTEIDTGSDLYVIESSYAGSNIYYTGESITLAYDHGTIKRSGLVGYTSVSFLSENGATLISTTSNQVPVVVVPDGVISNVESQNHAIMGMRMDGNVSVRLFLPYPYNQMFIMNMPERQLVFGNFTTQQMSSFGMVQAPESACDSYTVHSSSNNLCWDDMNLPVKYTATKDGTQVQATFNSLFDSGASSSFQFKPLPDWLVVSDTNKVKNPVAATIMTTQGPMALQLTEPTSAFANESNGGIVNVGNNIFNFYQVLYNQVNGQVGLKRVANPETTTVPLVYNLQGESMGLHMPLMVGNNLLYAGVDTGSVGLRVLESAITDKTGITITAESESYSYQDGVSLTGLVATAPVTIGGVTENIKFMVITNVSCLAQIPDCPKNAFIASGRAGLMGISLYIGGSTHGVWNPLSQLPGALANGFYLDGNRSYPGLTIGLSSDKVTRFDYIDLQPITQPESNPAPYSLWNVNLPARVEYPSKDGTIALSQTGSVLYDTGTAAYTIYNVGTQEQGTFPNHTQINQKQQLNGNKSFDWSFATGSEYYIDSAVKVANSFPLVVNTGNIPFITYDILYDVESGKMGFRKH